MHGDEETHTCTEIFSMCLWWHLKEFTIIEDINHFSLFTVIRKWK